MHLARGVPRDPEPPGRHTPVPSFNSREEIVEYAEEQAQLVGIGKLDPRLSAEMLAARAREDQR